MTRYIAFLRAINVGGHTVKMDVLRGLFEGMGFTNIETFIASGNVIFDSKTKPDRALEEKIEKTLREALGFEVATFIRSDAELAAVVAYEAFPRDQIEAAAAYNVAFLGSEPRGDALIKVMALQTELDVFHIHGRELYWLCKVKQSDSKISNNAFEKALGQRTTMRQVSTMGRLTAKVPPVG
jgi:uncharacterized protein (DUF1697 family)